MNEKLTNEQARAHAIQNAFGTNWNMLSLSIQHHLLIVHPWVDMSRMGLYPRDFGLTPEEVEVNSEFWRPIALKGLEENNGWTRIELDGSNLPEDGVYEWVTEKGNYTTHEYKKGDDTSYKTHFRKPDNRKPIY